MEQQLVLFPDDALDAAFRRLGPRAARASHAYVDTRRQLYAWRTDPETGAVSVRAHRVFRAAPDAVADAVWRIVLRRAVGKERRRLSHVVNVWFQTQDVGVRPAARRAPPRDPAAGTYVDLRPAFERLRAARLPSDFVADLAWGPRPARTILARFERGVPHGRIVVNPLLDSPLTPAWYLDFLLFHEALHALYPPRPGRGRMIVHPPEFRRAERSHPDFPRAKSFERWATGRGFSSLLGRASVPAPQPAALR